MNFAFTQVDVFTDTPLRGNPLAVVHAAQGTRLERAGRVHIARDGDTVWVGGHSISCIRGELNL